MVQNAPALRAALSLYSLVLLSLLAVRFAPLTTNRDDFIRYYFGGYVGFVQIRGGERATALEERIAEASSSLPSTHDRLRFEAGRTPYVPFFIVTSPVGIAAYGLFPSVHPNTWILGFHTFLWTLGIGAGALFVLRRPTLCSTTWFLAAGVVVAWLNVHTSPFVPAPRGVSTLAAGLALACYLDDARDRAVLLLLALAPLFHPYQHLMNVGALFFFVLLVWSDEPLAFLKSAATWRVGACALAAALLGVALVWLGNSMSFPEFTSMLDRRSDYDVFRNWSVNREAFDQTLKNVGPLLVALVFLRKGLGRALRTAALFGGGLVLVALLGQSGEFYPGEYVHRWAAMWTVILFALLMKQDLFRELSISIAKNRLWVTTGIVFLGLLFLYGAFNAWDPLSAGRRFEAPSAKEWGPVESQCIRLLLDPV